MTPPAPAPAPAVPSTAVPPPRSAPHLHAVREPAHIGWTCDNCELPNVARRRRCTDCGTSRY